MSQPARVCPVLVTPRLTLSAHATSDFDDCLQLWTDPRVVRHIGGLPASAEEVWSRLLRYAGLWSLLGFGYWAIRETASGRFVGEAGLADFRRPLAGLAGAPEAGWALCPWAHGQGFAIEATRALLAWADESLAAPRLVCMIAPANAASLALADRIGFRAFQETAYKGAPTRLFERRNPRL